MSAVTSLPFYYDWQFWSAVAAFAALALSQVPPIHVLLRRPRLRTEAFRRLHLNHRIGSPHAQWHLIIENVGGRSIRVQSIELVFRRAGSDPFVLPAQTYLRTPDATDAVMLTPFRLAPGEEWGHVLNFFNLYLREEEREFRVVESAIRTDISRQKEDPANRDKMCEASLESVALAKRFFDRRFQWLPGEYELELKVTTDIGDANLSKTYLFSLFESESAELKSYSDGYKFGAGVYWVSSSQPGILIPLREK